VVVELRGVRKRYGDLLAVDNLTLRVPRGEIVALLGPSGCGKSTTLRLIAGLEEPDGGEIALAGRPVAGPGTWVHPESRGVGMVFQDYALFPHLTVGDNIAFPLSRLARRERDRRAGEMLALVGLPDLNKRYPHELSGGQQQRVALARALAAEPAVVLLDEPFSNLDAALRKELREELRSVLRAANTAALFVTHDQEEAFSLADRVAVMDCGLLLQLDTPRQLYRQPCSRAIAAFVGEANFLPGQASGDRAATALGTLPLLVPASGPVDLLLRPETIALTPDGDGLARVEAVTYAGPFQLVRLGLRDGTTLRARVAPELEFAPGMAVAVTPCGPFVAYPR
jgi:iron(III) transport system ATP-binding protein